MPQRLKTRLLVGLVSALCVIVLSASTKADQPKRILVLMPFQTDRSGPVTLLEGMEEGLRASFQGNVEIVAESVAPVPPEPLGFSERMDDWLAFKYGQQEFDVIVALTSPAIPDAEALRDKLWPEAPILLVLQEEDRSQFPKFVRRSARVLIALSNAETVRSAMQMLPSTKHLVFLGGASGGDRQANAELLKNIRAANPNLDVIAIMGDSWGETKKRVQSVPDQSIILLGSFFFDRDNREMTIPEQVEELAALTKAPVFVGTDEAMGKGEIGGSVASIRAAGVAAGEQLTELLNGADPAKLPLREVDNAFIADWRQLEKWEISTQNLPPNATILYRPPGLWDQYSRYITAITAVFLLLLTMVVFLLIERHRRKKEEELNSAMLEALPGLALLVSPSGEILRTNQAPPFNSKADAVSKSLARPGGKYGEYLHSVSDAANDPSGITPIGEVISGSRATATAELKLRNDKGWMEVRAIQLREKGSGSLIVHLDITQRKQAELERIDSRAQIYHLNRVGAMGQLAASLAHELSQPLAAILSNAEAAHRFADRPNPDMVEIREALEDITRDDKRARSIMQNMRTMLKKDNPSVGSVDLNQVASSVVQMIKNEASLRSMAIELQLSPNPVLVKGDEVGLQQVVLNLANNGLDAMTSNSGDRCLTIRTASEVGGNMGMLWVQDSGPGVPPDLRDQLFQPFFTTKRTGLGMGLSICRSILEARSGQIGIKDDSGKGAEFFIELPLA